MRPVGYEGAVDQHVDAGAAFDPGDASPLAGRMSTFDIKFENFLRRYSQL